MSVDTKLGSRRPNSIFSRRGSTAPANSNLTSIVEARTASVDSPSDRHKQSIKTKSRELKNSSGMKKSSKAKKTPSDRVGTVLNAVPPAASRRMSASESDKYTGTNEQSSPSGSAFSPTSRNSLFSTASKDLDASKNTRPSSRNSKTPPKRSNEAQIGYWQNGKFYWDDGKLRERLTASQAALADGGSIHRAKSSTSTPDLTISTRPRLAVAIPSAKSFIADSTLASFLQDMQKRPEVPSTSSAFSPKTAPDIIPRPQFPRVLSSPEVLPTDPVRSQSVSSASSRDGNSSTKSRNSYQSGSDRRSRYSSQSSTTSVEADESADKAGKTLVIPDLTLRRSFFDDISPGRAGVFDADTNKPLPPTPNPKSPLRYPNATPPTRRLTYSGKDHKLRKLIEEDALQCSTTSDVSPPAPLRASSTRFDRLDVASSPYNMHPAFRPQAITPTLSQAEDALENELSALEIKEKDDSSSLSRHDSFHSARQSPSPAPTVPKRSRKREWQGHGARHSTDAETALGPRRRASESFLHISPEREESAAPARRVTNRKSMTAWPPVVRRDFAHAREGALPALFEDGLIVVEGPVVLRRSVYSDYMAQIPMPSSEAVLFSILSSLPTLKDLCNTAVINQGMYHVFKQNEAQLVHQVAFNESPAAWEFRQWSLHEQSNAKGYSPMRSTQTMDQTMTACLQTRDRDASILDSLKKLIVDKCASFMRRETSTALSDPESRHAKRFDDAFWRIWSFCKAFGGDQERENDVAGQLDWLKGGPVANNGDFGATLHHGFAFDAEGVLLNPPEFFGRGNGDGLSAEELYDMLELWTCMASLLQDYHGHVEDSREAGVYDRCGPIEGSQEQEESMLEEWILHLLTLGPSVVLDMAEFDGHYVSEGFSYANANEWTSWSPPQQDQSRILFLREPVSRLYHERISAANAQRYEIVEGRARREMDRRRVATLAAEIKLARQNPDYQNVSMADMKKDFRSSYSSSGSSSVRNSVHYITSTSPRKHHHQRSSFVLPTPPPTASSNSSPRSSRSIYSEQNHQYHQEYRHEEPQREETHQEQQQQLQSQSQSQRHRRSCHHKHKHSRSTISSTGSTISSIPEDSLPTSIATIPRNSTNTAKSTSHNHSHSHSRITNSSIIANTNSQHFLHGEADDTADLAVRAVVEMGFTPREARHALRVTDAGDGLRVDRAVEFLLARQ